MRKVVVSILIALTIGGVIQAQTASGGASINGSIKDPQGANVPGAIVRLYGRERSFSLVTVTDASGSYSFKNLAAGEYLVEAEANGFALAPAQSVDVERGKTTTHDVTLELSGLRSAVVITASDTPQTVDEVSKALTVVADQEIDERDELAIPEALRTVAGLRVQQLGGPGSLTSIKTRGLPSEDTAVLIDGIRFRDAAATQGDASGFLEDLMVTDVSRVEVLRGSGSSLYGSNAVGGVVNIVTDEGGGPIHGSVLGEGGDLGLFRTRAQLAGGARNNRLVYSGGFSFFNIAHGIDDQDEARTTSGQGRILFRLTPTATLTGRIYTAKSRLEINSNPEGIGTLPAGIIEAIPFSTFIPDVNDPDSLREANFFDSAITFTQRPTEA